MALELEDGTGKANSVSYVDAPAARAYAAARGVTLSEDDSAVEVLLIKAADYLEAQRARYQGTKTTATQAMQWPRANVYIDDSEDALADDAIPTALKNAQCQLVLELHSGADLMPTTDGRVVKRKKTDVLETEYMTAQEGGAGSAAFPKVEALLAPLLNGSSGWALTTERV